jgi:hypothetical protein
MLREVEGQAIPVEGADPSEVISQVERALAAADAKRPGGLGLGFESVDLALATALSREGGVDLKFTVPFVEWEAGLGGKVGKESTTVIAVSLEPAPSADVAVEGIEGPLTDAILATADTVTRLKETSPHLALKGASVELEFVYSRTGSVSLLVASGAQTNVTTHTLTLNLKEG